MLRDPESRRVLFTCACGVGALLVLSASARAASAPRAPAPPPAASETEVTPTEDLMREHGVLRRALLVYREAIRRLEAKEPLPFASVAEAAELTRRFIHQYHEKIEEELVFPRLASSFLKGLTQILKEQHDRGSKLTDTVRRLAGGDSQGPKGGAERRQLVTAMQLFIRMYEPHAAREDTVVFPAFKATLTPAAYHELGDTFEDRERKLFGEDGFANAVATVAALEKSLGIEDLAQFTPPPQ